MHKAILSVMFVLTLASLMLPLVAADVDLEVLKPEDREEFVLDDSVMVKIKVVNHGEETAQDVTFSASAEGVAVSLPDVGDIPGGSTVTFDLEISNANDDAPICKETYMKIEFTYTEANMRSSSDHVTIKLVPPRVDLNILSPQQVIKLVDFPEGGSTTVGVLVKNEGSRTITGVGLEVVPRNEQMACSISGGASNIAASTSVSYSLTCSDINDSDKLDLRLYDGCGTQRDFETVRFELVEGFKDYRLEIVDPVENDGVILSEVGGAIDVTVHAKGQDALTGVCVYAFDINSIPGACADIDAGQNKVFTINLVPDSDLKKIMIFANDSTGQAEDEKNIWVTRVLALDEPVANTTEPEVVNGTNPVTDVPEAGSTGFVVTKEMFAIIIILIPVLMVVVYVGRSLKKTTH